MKSEFMAKHYSGVLDKLKVIGKSLSKKGLEFDMAFAGTNVI
jgi:hypothetical protein